MKKVIFTNGELRKGEYAEIYLTQWVAIIVVLIGVLVVKLHYTI
jgi:hypothetical protein